MRTTDPGQLSSGNAVQQQAHLVFDRMTRQIARVSKDAKPENVHRFRTNGRRVEVLVGNLSPQDANTRKLLKRLSKLRRKAGKVRDLDVQIAFLKELKIPDRQNHRAILLDKLTDEQQKQSRKFVRSLDRAAMRKLRKRLRKAKTETNLSEIDPLKVAFSRLPKTGQWPLNEKNLHACRISAKHARYLAELCPDSVDAKLVVGELKKAQDEIGRWHDVLKLTERAQELFGGVRDSALVSALENINHARFRRAGSALHSALKAISEIERRNRASVEFRPQPAESSARVAAA
jgi:CHAD domain-containing protein